MAVCARQDKNYAAAGELELRSLARSRQIGDRRSEAISLGNLETLEAKSGHVEFGRSHLRQMLTTFQQLNDPLWIATANGSLSVVATLQSEPERALRLGAASEAHLEKLGSAGLFRAEHIEVEVGWQHMRELIDAHRAASAWEEGQNMSLEEAIDFALSECEEVGGEESLQLESPSSESTERAVVASSRARRAAQTRTTTATRVGQC